MPDFLYKPAYDEKHRHIYFDADAERRSVRFSGFWQELFCDDCEGRFNEWETYFADVWFAHRLRPTVIPVGHFSVTGLDYKRFKLFHLSVLWRAGAASIDPFHHVKLGRHQERLRRMLLQRDPGPPDVYPVMAVALRDPENSGFVDSILSLPAAARIQGHTVYRSIFGGIAWYCAMSSHRSGCPVTPALQEAGVLWVLSQDWTKHPAILEVGVQMRRLYGSDSSPAA